MSIILCSSLSTRMLRSCRTTTTTTTPRTPRITRAIRTTRTTRTTRSSSWTTRTTRRPRTTWTPRTTWCTSSTTNYSTTTTTLPSHLCHSMYSSLPTSMLSTKETQIDKDARNVIHFVGLLPLDISGSRSNLFKNLSSKGYLQEFAVSVEKTFLYQQTFLYLLAADNGIHD